MTKGDGRPTIPTVDGGLLVAWHPWTMAGASANLLAQSRFAADEPFWFVHLYAALNLLVSCVETLKNVDRQVFPNQKAIFNIAWARLHDPAGIGLKPYRDFVLAERNPLHHRAKSKVVPIKVQARPFLWDGHDRKLEAGMDLSYEGEGEDPLQLFGLAFQEIEETLRVLDQAVFLDNRNDLNRAQWADFDHASYDRVHTTGLDYNF